MVNRVTLVGNLGRDPEMNTLESGVAYTKFTLATNESYKDKNGEWQQQTEWHNIVLWRDAAERAAKQLKKGSKVYIEGKLQTRSWDGKDGEKRYITEIRVQFFRTLDRIENAEMSNATNTGTTVTPVIEEPAADDLPF